MLLLIDNYDSFVYNLAHYFRQEGEEVRVVRNDAVTLDDIAAMRPDFIVVSPGPGAPIDAGISVEAIRRFAPEIPILGVCLGHQAIGEAFGGRIVRAKNVMHGKTSDISHDGQTLFAGVEQPLKVTRYHSLVIEKSSVPDDLEIVAISPDDEIMAVRHKKYRTWGVQFHPESIMTVHGRRLCKNFLTGGRKRLLIREALDRVMSGDDLARDEAEDVMEDIMSGVATPAQIAAWLVAMRNKGETPEEIAACVAIMRRFAKPLRAPEGVILDTCGTGGDGAGTFNISTVAALVVAGAGVRVAKHGNRSITSKCGSADVLTELAVNITCPAERMERALANANIGFAFAPLYHGAMRHAIGPRREIGVRTLFNMLGPMTNPAGARHQLIGVFEKRLTRFFADVLHLLGSERALVVHGSDGLDEITLTGPTYAAELRGGSIREFDIDPREFGLTLCDASDLAGGSPWENKCIALEILDGAKGPKRDIVLLNAGAALYVAGNAEDIAAGIRLAADSIDGGRARAALNRLIEETRDDEPA